MHVNLGQSEQYSLTAAARRAQIVDATITTISEVGYRQASFAKIAATAKLSSTRLISYHFASKDKLMRAVVEDVVAGIRTFMSERLADLPDARSTLLAYIRGRVEFAATHRAQMDALMSIFLELRGPADQKPDDTTAERRVLQCLEQILKTGQEAGEFRDFDPFVMAATIQRGVDGLPYLLRTMPTLDLDAFADELATTFDLATRSAP
jgi:AcrR family transcriptional regulator